METIQVIFIFLNIFFLYASGLTISNKQWEKCILIIFVLVSVKLNDECLFKVTSKYIRIENKYINTSENLILRSFSFGSSRRNCWIKCNQNLDCSAFVSNKSTKTCDFFSSISSSNIVDTLQSVDLYEKIYETNEA